MNRLGITTCRVQYDDFEYRYGNYNSSYWGYSYPHRLHRKCRRRMVKAV